MQGYVYDNNQPQGYYAPNQGGYSQPQPQGYCPPQMDHHQHPHPHQQQQQHTVVMVNQPHSQGTMTGQPQNIRQWTSGMCGCCEDCTGCMYCFFCHPCFMCTLATKMDECVCGPFCLGYTFETSMRTKLRAQFGIQGSVLDDVCCMMWCNPCIKHQMYREIKHLGYKP
jgi:Cys-rich protein (TIGR01571 family)